MWSLALLYLSKIHLADRNFLLCVHKLRIEFQKKIFAQYRATIYFHFLISQFFVSPALSPNQSTMESSPMHPWNLSPENLASLPSSDKPRQVDFNIWSFPFHKWIMHVSGCAMVAATQGVERRRHNLQILYGGTFLLWLVIFSPFFTGFSTLFPFPGFYYLTTKILLPTICNVLGARSTLSRRTSSDSLLTTFCKGLCNFEPI